MAKKKVKKWLYDFTISREVEKERTSTSTKDGKKVEVTEKYEEVMPVSFHLKKPNRRLYDDAELFYGVKMSEGIKAGLLTRNLLAKRYEDDGGAFSENEKQRYGELYMTLYNKENEYQKLQLNLDNKSQDLKEELTQNLLVEISDMRRELTDIENSQSNIFDQTAENRAKNQTIMWWVLNLAHWKEYDHNEISPFFGTGSYDEKLEQYDLFEDSDEEFHVEAIRKLAYFVSFWYMGRATSSEEFAAVEDLYNTQNTEEELEDVAEEDMAAEDMAAEDVTEKAEEEVLEEEEAEAKPKKKRGKPKTKKVKKEEVKEEVEATVELPTESAEEASAETIVAEAKTNITSKNED